MRSASTAFAQAITKSHRFASRVDVLFDRQVIAEGIPVVDGTVTYDRTAARLASINLTVADPTRLPVAADDILTPFGYEIQAWRGVQIPSAPADNYLAMLTDDYVTVPDEPALDVTGDLDIIWRCRMGTTSAIGAFVSKGFFAFEVTNFVSVFFLAINGANQGSCTFANLGVSYGTTYWFRVTRNATSGAIDWYVQPDSRVEPAAWGAAKTDAGTQAAGAINTNGRPLTIGARPGLTSGDPYTTFLDGDMFDVIVKSAGSTVFEMRSSNLKQVPFPVSSGQTATPAGAKLLPGRSLVTELVSLGVFPIQSSSVDGVTLLSSIVAEDRSRLVSDARFEDDYQIAAGTNYTTAIQELIEDGVPGLKYLFPSTTFTTPLLTFAAQEDRWEKASQMAKSIGMELLFDGFGRPLMRPEPTFSGTPVATIAEGANMTAASMALDRAPAYNRVIATGRNASLTIQPRGVATDNNPASPTYYLGPFGKKPRFFASEFISSDAQASTAAAAILAANIGVARSVDFSAVPDPRLECSDVVQVTRTPLGIDDLHIIETLKIGLTADSSMSGTSRAQQVAT